MASVKACKANLQKLLLGMQSLLITFEIPLGKEKVNVLCLFFPCINRDCLFLMCTNGSMFCSILTGTAAVALAGLLAAQRAIGKPITEHRVLFLGAGEVDYIYTVIRYGYQDRNINSIS